MDTSKPVREPTKLDLVAKRALKHPFFWRISTGNRNVPMMAFLTFCVGLTLAFSGPLHSLAVRTLTADLHSHILLIPLISVYLIYLNHKKSQVNYACSPICALVPLSIGLIALGFAWRNYGEVWSAGENDCLTLVTLCFVSFVVAGGFFFLGRPWMLANGFPFAFLIFMVPLPDQVAEWLESASKLASAEAANIFFAVSGEPVLRDGTIFQLPGMVLEVAQECSGIHSSWVLFITAILASQLFLKSPWPRILLVLFVVPLGILRNGFRIMVIGLLCTHVGPQMVNSPIHKQGGPIFFALSLAPFLLLLWWLRRGEERAGTVRKSKRLLPAR
jgi:exosortase C (VPDSG-CTERM-specific)